MRKAAKATQASLLRKSILQAAVEGKLVPQNANDEPASVLLARIKAEKAQRIKDGKLKKEKALPPVTEEEKPFDLPEGWEWVRLNEILYFTDAGKSPSCEKRAANLNEWGVIRTTSVQENYFLEQENKVLPQGFIVDKRMQVQVGDILITRAGPKNRTGIACFVEQCTYKLILSDKTVRLNCNAEHLYKPFLVCALNSMPLRNLLNEKMTGMAESQVNLSQPSITSILFPLPPLAEQERIVSKIQELMPLCDQLEEAEKAATALDAHFMEFLPKSILQAAVEGKLVPQDSHDEPASILLERIKKEKAQRIKDGKLKKEKPLPAIAEDEKPFALPEGWEWCRLGEICTKITDGSHNPPPNTGKGYPVISAKNIKNGQITFENVDRFTDDKGFLRENPRTNITTGDIIMGIIGGSIGNIAIYNYQKKVIAQRSIAIINSAIKNSYTKIFLSSPYLQSLLGANTSGTAQGGIYLGQLKSLFFPLPPLAEQKRIVAKVEELMQACAQGKIYG